MARTIPLFVSLALALALAPALPAQERASPCFAIARAAPQLQFVQLAGYGQPLEEFTLRINYVAHSTFLIETPGGLQAATDYAGFLGDAGIVPDVVTMNRAHPSHFTDMPDPRIPHVLKGWNPEGGPARYNLDLGEMWVRNATTDIRDGFGGAIEDGNSIFVFEVAGLCIGHLGHLHHEPDEATYAALGRLDVVMAPVDGSLTLDLVTMIRVLKRLKSSVVLPMHWFGDFTLEAFVAGMADEFDIRWSTDSFVELSLRTLPKRPTVVVLRPRFLRLPRP